MIEVVVGDITGLAVDCIVNAANSSLMGGAGVDGAIHRGAGPRLLDECRRIGGCPTGDARMTGGFDLAARHVVHAVDPDWKGGMEGEDELLASCYRRSFELAEAVGARSIAFPAISTGAYGLPKERAAVIAVREMTAREDRLERIIACCFSEADAAFYRRLLPAPHLGPRPNPAACAETRDPRRQSNALVDLAEQHPARVGTDPATIESTSDRAPAQGVKLKLLTSTLCSRLLPPRVA